MRVAIALLAALVLAPAASSAQVKRGTIAVIPFGAAGPTMTETAAAFSVSIENALMESGHFVEVLPRSGDSAIQAEITKTTEPANLNSLVQIAQDAQLNANYVLSGWVTGQDVKAGQDANGKPTHTAQVRLVVRILDVSKGAMVMSETIII
ncbi:MAG: hypothetical protein ACREMA_06120, partial [Longimicrobiales bacterium]